MSEAVEGACFMKRPDARGDIDVEKRIMMLVGMRRYEKYQSSMSTGLATITSAFERTQVEGNALSYLQWIGMVKLGVLSFIYSLVS